MTDPSTFKVGDRIGPVSQLRPPRIQTSCGVVTHRHDDGLTVAWQGEERRYWFVAQGMMIEQCHD